jgi:hypothetical protein
MTAPQQREAIVILTPEAGAHAADEIGRRAGVIQRAGRRVLMVDAASAERLAALPGVARVLTDAAEAGDLGDLDPGDALFVQAWAARQAHPKTEPRPGDGLPWDAPGHEAP